MVIGTGAGGAVVGRELAEAGLAVVFVEQGRYFDRAEFSGRPFEMQQKLYRRAGSTFSIGNAAIPIPLGQTVGGSTTVNSGTCGDEASASVMKRWRTKRLCHANSVMIRTASRYFGSATCLHQAYRSRT